MLMTIGAILMLIAIAVMMYSVMPQVDPNGNPVKLPISMLVVLPVFYLLFGYIAVATGCVIYNFAYRFIGGLEFEVEEKTNNGTRQDRRGQMRPRHFLKSNNKQAKGLVTTGNNHALPPTTWAAWIHAHAQRPLLIRLRTPSAMNIAVQNDSSATTGLSTANTTGVNAMRVMVLRPSLCSI